MAELQLHVHGMDCAEETALVRRALEPLRGVSRLDFDLIRGFVRVQYDETRLRPAAIAAAVRGTGLRVHESLPADAAAEPAGYAHDRHLHARTRLWAVASGALFVAGWVVQGLAADRWFDTFVEHAHDARSAALYGLSAAAALWPMAPRALASVRHRRLDMHVLVSLTVLGAAATGAWSEGAAVALLFAIAHEMEAWSLERARAAVAALVGRGPALIADGLQAPAPVERWIERFAAVYTPVVATAALVLALVPPLVDGQWSVWFYRALVFIVLACPCALVISTPVTVVAALTSAARRGVLVKGGAALERAATAAEPSRAALAAVGVSIAGVQDGTALAAADVVLAELDPRAIAFLVQHARHTLRVIHQNVAIALVTKAAFLVSAPFGFAPLWMAVLADTGATVIVTLNGLRLLRGGRD